MESSCKGEGLDLVFVTKKAKTRQLYTTPLTYYNAQKVFVTFDSVYLICNINYFFSLIHRKFSNLPNTRKTFMLTRPNVTSNVISVIMPAMLKNM